MRISKRRWCGARTLVAVAALAMLAGTQTAAADTRFTVVDSASSSAVARGYKDYNVTPEAGWMFTPSRNFDNGITFNLAGPALEGTDVTTWRIDFAAPNDAMIVPGVYEDLERFPFQSPGKPGMAFASNGVLDNYASGFFRVYEATYGAGGSVLTFAADFTYFGDANLGEFAVAELRYNAVPEPGVALLALGSLPLLLRRRSQRR